MQDNNIIEANYTIVDANENNDMTYDIIVKNAASGAKTSCLVYPDNILEQVIQEVSAELGIGTQNVLLVNESTQKSTSDLQMTIEDFGLRNGFGLTIHPDCRVA